MAAALRQWGGDHLAAGWSGGRPVTAEAKRGTRTVTREFHGLLARARDAEPDCVSEVDPIADRSDRPPHQSEDADKSLANLGYRPPSSRRGSGVFRRYAHRVCQANRARLLGDAHQSVERSYLWAEAVEGRLRQGWGAADEQNLYVIAEAVRNGRRLSAHQQEARRALRMVSSWPGRMQVGDIVVAPHLPQYGRLSVFRIVGAYEWSLGPALTWGERFGHVLQVELIEQDIDRHGRGL